MYYKAQVVFSYNDLEHHGVKGQKWGVINSKPSEGKKTLGQRIKGMANTAKEYGKSIINDRKQYRKNLKAYRNRGEMSNEELFNHMQRVRMENEFKKMVQNQRSEVGILARDTLVRTVVPAAVSASLVGGVAAAKVGTDIYRGTKALKAAGKTAKQIRDYQKSYVTDTASKYVTDQAFKALERKVMPKKP